MIYRDSIGQMAQLNHISEQTLRLYDREGILKVQEVDPETDYRYYHILQSARIDLIQNMKMYGLTLKEIRSLLDCGSTEPVKEKLEVQYADIEAGLQELEQIREHSISNYSCFCQQDFFQEDESGDEYMLRQMQNQLIHNEILVLIDFEDRDPRFENSVVHRRNQFLRIKYFYLRKNN